jgi:peptide/nickel transport system permease protein
MPAADLELATEPDAPAHSPSATAAPRTSWGPGFWLAAAWLGALLVALVLTPWLPIDDPNSPSGDLFAPPSGEALFGTDELGRDMLARVLWGGRASMAIGFSALVLGFVVGGAIGITAGFFGGLYERVVMATMDLMLSFPSLILALALIAALSEPGTQQGSFTKLVFVLSVLAVPALARITRANTLVYSRREFVTAARSLGAGNRRILVREILPNVLPSMLSFAFLALAILVIAEGALAFLGLSVEAPSVTWGKLIELGRRRLETAAYLTFIPCAFLFLTLLSLNLIGDRLQARFAVREGQA